MKSHKSYKSGSYKSGSYKFLPALVAIFLVTSLSSCSQSDSNSDFEGVTPPPLEIPSSNPVPTPDSGELTAPSPDAGYNPIPTAPLTGDAVPSPNNGFEAIPSPSVPTSSPDSTIPFSTGQPVIPSPSSGIQVAPQNPAVPYSPVPAPGVPAPAAPVPAVPNTVPNLAPNAAPNSGNPGIYVPPASSL